MALGVPHAPKVSKWMAGFLEDPSTDSLHCPGPKILKVGVTQTPPTHCVRRALDPQLTRRPAPPGENSSSAGRSTAPLPADFLQPANHKNNTTTTSSK